MAPRVLIVDDNAELLGLLSSVFEDAGYSVIQAQRSRVALERAKAERPDFAIVDVLLPDLMGYEVAAYLRQLKIPFVMISGVFKGGKHGLEAIQRHGAVAYFEKPFEVDRLVEKVSSIVPPQPAGRPGPATEELEEAELLDVDVDFDEQGAHAWELTGRVSVTDQGANRVTATLSGESIKVPATPRVLARPPASRPPPPPAAAPPVMAPTIALPVPVPVPANSRVGQLKNNLPQLISAFYLAQETGELVCQRGAVRKVVYFEKGNPVFATSNLSTDRFGQFLVRIGKVPEDDLKAAAHVAERTKQRTGDVLIEMGILTDNERMYFVGQQVKAIIYSLFAWEDGSWQLTFKKRARAEMLKLDLHPANLILRGVKKLYSPARLAQLLPDAAMPIPAQDPSYLLSDVELESAEALVLARVDGTRTVEALAATAKKTPDQIRGLLVGLVALRIIEISH